MKDDAIRQSMASIENRVRHLYNQGFEAGRKAERKTGKWIEKDGWDGDVYYDCSACGESWTTIEGTPWDNDMNYCPHCGAKMEGADNGTN